MATESTTNTTTIIARADQHDIDLHKASDRVNFGSIKEPIDVPYLPVSYTHLDVYKRQVPGPQGNA